jgi:3-methyladenine DNA glycosylase AlkD
LFSFIEPLMLDEQRVVQQGLGWFLREAWKLKRKETEAFLLKWKDESPPADISVRNRKDDGQREEKI